MDPERLGPFERFGLLAASAATVVASLSLRVPSAAIFVDMRVSGTECVASFETRPSFHLRLRCR
jgi:hypothetical protein